MNIRLTCLLLSSMICLNACTTGMMWDSAGRGANKTRQETDSIVAFAAVKPNSKTLSRDSVVMLGNQYIYVLYDKDKELRNLLNAKLPRAFEVHKYHSAFKPNLLGYFPIEIDQSQGKNPEAFMSIFCLYYPNAGTLNEIQTLDKLGFETYNGNNRYKCMTRQGLFYAKPADMKYDYRFETPIPAQLTVQYTTPKGSSSKVWRILATPFTAAVDIVTFPLQAAGLALMLSGVK